MALKDYGSSKNTLGYFDKIIGDTDGVGLFVFTGAAHIDPHQQADGRCDEGAVGPIAFTWTGQTPYALPLPLKSYSNIKYVKPIIDHSPDFYIIYGEGQETKLEMMQRTYDTLPSWQQEALDKGFTPPHEYVDATHIEDALIPIWPQRCARTLGELFKLIIEWAEVAKEPFNNTEQAALICTCILEKLAMPDDVKAELIEQYPDSHVAMYIRGNENATQRPEGIPNIPPLFDDWITEIMLNYPYRGPIRSM